MVKQRLQLVFTQEEINRIKVVKPDVQHIQIIVNVHGMECFRVRRFIRNIINVVHKAFQLIIIHGYNHGTAIKDMLANNFNNQHIKNKYVDFHNPGVTHMQIAA